MIRIYDHWQSLCFPLIATWSSDMHRVERLGPATYLQAPALTFDDLMRAYYEGRSYLAPNNFGGRAIFNLGDSTTNPYPARYPVYVSPDQALARVRFAVDGGIASGSKVVWTRNGTVIATDATNGPTYDATRSVSLTGAFTYIRAELRDAANLRIAMSQPIFFLDASAALPAGLTYHVEGVSTPDNRGYTKITTKGITASSWDSLANQLSLTLTDPAGSLAELAATTGSLAPSAVEVDGTAVAPAASAADFDSASGSSWYYDATRHVLRLKARQATGTTPVAVAFATGSDTEAPSPPANLQATVASATEIDLSWDASPSGDVDGYTVYRGGTPIASLPASITTFADTGLTQGTAYTYTVDAFDSAQNHSAQTAPVTRLTRAIATQTFTAAADTYVDATKPTTSYGTLTTLRVDGLPVQRSYLRFNVAGLSGRVERATLRVFANSSAPGYEVHGVADNTWAESINYNTAPAFSPTSSGLASNAAAGTWTTADVTPLIGGNGTVSVELEPVSTTAANHASRESANPPQLVIETSSAANGAPSALDRSLAATSGAAASWTPSVSDPDGDALTCSIVNSPAHGTASVASDCSSGSYTSDAGYTGSDSFTYEATDSSGADSGPATVSVTVSAANGAPTAVDRSLAATSGAAASWTPSVSDPDGDALTCSIVGAPANGTASVASDCSTGSYTSTGGYTGPDSFTYKATDPSGADSSAATVTVTVGSPVVFGDGFESGNLSAWGSSKGLTVQSAIVRGGSFAAEGNTTNGNTWARRTLGGTYGEITYRTFFRLESPAPAGSSVTLVKLRTAADQALVGVYVSTSLKLGLRNDITAANKSSTAAVQLGRWYALDLHVIINGAASTVDVLLDSTRIASLSGTANNLGTTPVGMLQLGELSTARTYHVFFDDVSASG
jgi:Bacterial Ig domain/Fibronectin type III domain